MGVEGSLSYQDVTVGGLSLRFLRSRELDSIGCWCDIWVVVKIMVPFGYP